MMKDKYFLIGGLIGGIYAILFNLTYYYLGEASIILFYFPPFWPALLTLYISGIISWLLFNLFNNNSLMEISTLMVNIIL